MTTDNGHDAPAQTCAACGRPIPIGSDAIMEEEAGTRRFLHEVCGLRQALVAEQAKLSALAGLFGAVLFRLGNATRVHIADIRAAKVRGSITSRAEPGGFLLVWIGEEPRIVLATGVTTPRG